MLILASVCIDMHVQNDLLDVVETHESILPVTELTIANWSRLAMLNIDDDSGGRLAAAGHPRARRQMLRQNQSC
jgi:hypothetical protein